MPHTGNAVHSLQLVLEGANASAEGEDADEGADDTQTVRVLDIEDQFRLNKLEGKPTKKSFQVEIKSEPG
jgi:Translationally controlled tumour protein